MTDREKLIALIAKAHNATTDACLYNDLTYAEAMGFEADYLLANGVTVQKWIPVTERLPEVGCNVLVIDRVTGEVATAHLNDLGSFVFEDGRGHGATHWMPLPRPPKEE